MNWAVLCYWYQAVFVKMMPNRLTVSQLLFISVTFPRANCVYNNEMPFEGYVCDTAVFNVDFKSCTFVIVLSFWVIVRLVYF